MSRTPITVTVLSVLLLLTWAALAAAGPRDDESPGRYEEAQSRMPGRFFRIDVLDAGPVFFGNSYYPASGQGVVFLKATCQWNRFRFSAAYLDFVGDIGDGSAGPMPICMHWPVYVGYDLWHNPKKTWFFYGAVPDVYAEVGVSFDYKTTVKAALACDLDYYCIGLRLEAGGYLNPAHENTLYATLYLRFLTFGIGF